MKKVWVGILAAAMAVSVGTTSALAAGPGAGRHFVDADGDGVCDNFGAGCSYVDADGDGICDSCGAYHRNPPAGNRRGGNFVDNDGDGICDNYPAGRGRGRATGFCGGRNR